MKGTEICIVWVDNAQSIIAGATRYGLQRSEVKLTVITSKLKLQMPDKKVKKRSQQLHLQVSGYHSGNLFQELALLCFSHAQERHHRACGPNQNQNPWFILLSLSLSSTVFGLQMTRKGLGQVRGDQCGLKWEGTKRKDWQEGSHSDLDVI